VGIGTDCIGSYKSNYHTITTTTAPGTIEPSYKLKRTVNKWKYIIDCDQDMCCPHGS